MCADRERGHIFTERLLESRVKTYDVFRFSVMEIIISELVDNVNLKKRKIFQNQVIQELKVSRRRKIA